MNIFERKINYNKITFRYARGKSLVTGEEIHSYHEILYFMKGNATFLSEQFEQVLKENTLIIIPKETYHKFQIDSHKDYTRLVFIFPDIPELNDLIDDVLSDIKIIENVSSNIMHLINRIIDVLTGNEQYNCQKPLLYASLYMLLAELNAGNLPAFTPIMRESDQLISRCIEYVDLNFARNISVKQICQIMHVSAASLHLCFKRHLGISVYKYITEKRLIYAHKLIANGSNPTKIYTDCGYNDYPTFYKAYVKMFGKPPCKDKPKIADKIRNKHQN